MHKGPHLRRVVSHLAWVSAWALTACNTLAPAPSPSLASFPEPAKGDGGIVIAQSKIILGASATTVTAAVPTSDCDGPAMSIDVMGSAATGNYVFDASGNPCPQATLLYDGRTQAGSRPADPTVNLAFVDVMGAIPGLTNTNPTPNRRASKAAPLAAIPQIKVDSQLLRDISASLPRMGDPLLQTLQQWQATDAITSSRATDADMAATRELTRMVRQVQEGSSSSAAAQLAAQLRERERQIAEEQRRHRETLARADKYRTQTFAARDSWQQEENRMASELAAAKARAAQFEELANRLKLEQQTKEKAYQDRIGTLSKSLSIAERQADANRSQLILQAAAKVAEAQALAKALQVDSDRAELAEASRLHAEANELMDKVLLSRGIVQAEPQSGNKVPLALKDVPVALQIKEKTLADILAEVLQQAAPQAGAWRADWQLSPQAQPMLKEKWSLTAEATVGEILQDLKKQLQDSGFSIQFNMFPQNRVLVITDSATPTTPAK
jgi:hypothetical protein